MHLSKRIISAVTCLASITAPLAANLNTVLAADTTETEQEFCAPISEVVQDSGLDIDYVRALQYSLYFYDANMCGEFKENENKLSWRGSCHTYDAHVPMIEWDKQTTKTSKGGTNLSASFMEKYKDILDPDGDGTIDVSGGFHDAGDHVEFGMPENYTAATLGWGYYEYRDVYEKFGLDSHIETILRHFNDYLMKCTFRDDDGNVIAHCYQVGEGNIDHEIWNSPEVDTMPRPAFFLTAEKPQIDYVTSACASLCVNYLNFKDTDKEYAEKSLDYAKSLWKFAEEAFDKFYVDPAKAAQPAGGDAQAQSPLLSDNSDGPLQFYKSLKWEDDYCWAAAWMYMATEDPSVFDNAYGIFDYYAPAGWAFCWDDKWAAAGVMWAIVNQQHPELDLVQKCRDAQGKNKYVFDNFWDSDCVGKCLSAWKATQTPQGFAHLSTWGSCRYNTSMQFICLLYDKYNNDGKPSEWSNWAKDQMDYILGKNETTFKERAKYTVLAGKNGTSGPRCYIVGYNDIAVKNPHHRAASGLLMAEDPREQKHILWGALAGGPDKKDQHMDETREYTENEVTIDYNAALPAAAAGLYTMFGTEDMALTPNFPPEDEKRVYGGGENGGSGYWIEALGIPKPNKNGDGSGTTQVSFKVLTGESNPSKNTSVRYFFNVKELAKGINGVTEVRELYDQSSTEDGAVGADGVISGPFKYDKVADTYYVEITWKDYVIANSGKKYQFDLGNYYGDLWDPENDWSYQGLKLGTSNDFFAVDDPPEERCDNICVYADGVLVGGVEPDGTKPEEPSSEPSSKSTTTTTTSTVTTSANKVTLYGDANCDKQVNIADAVLVMQVSTNPDKYAQGKSSSSISATGEANADVDGKKGLTNSDALLIQKHKLGLIKSFPVEA